MKTNSTVFLLGALFLIASPVGADENTGAVETSAAESSAAESAVAETPASTGIPRPGADRLQLDVTSIRGNQELPRVMVIVPWKDPAMGNLVGKPVNSLVDEVLTPVDRDVFRRQTKYFDQLYGSPGIGNDE